MLREVPHPLLAVLLEEGSHHVGVVASRAQAAAPRASRAAAASTSLAFSSTSREEPSVDRRSGCSRLVGGWPGLRSPPPCSRSLRLGDAASPKQLYAARSWKEGSLGSEVEAAQVTEHKDGAGQGGGERGIGEEKS